MIKNACCSVVLVLLLVLRTAAADEDPVFGDVYEEEGDPGSFIEGKAWKEQRLVLPAYPDTASADLIKVNLQLEQFPFSVWIDPASVTIGNDRVVRYTVILRSRSGATNVIYEGIRCVTGQFRRYAYGGPDGFHVSDHSAWKYIPGATGGSDSYLVVLRNRFICPSPPPGKPARLLRHLRASSAADSFYDEEE